MWVWTRMTFLSEREVFIFNNVLLYVNETKICEGIKPPHGDAPFV